MAHLDEKVFARFHSVLLSIGTESYAPIKNSDPDGLHLRGCESCQDKFFEFVDGVAKFIGLFNLADFGRQVYLPAADHPDYSIVRESLVRIARRITRLLM